MVLGAVLFSHHGHGGLSAESALHFHKASGPTQTGTAAPPETHHRVSSYRREHTE